MADLTAMTFPRSGFTPLKAATFLYSYFRCGPKYQMTYSKHNVHLTLKLNNRNECKKCLRERNMSSSAEHIHMTPPSK